MELFFKKIHGLSKMCINLLLIIFCFLPIITLADKSENVKNALGHPPKTVNGIISDDNGNPLPGVNVKIKGSNIGTVTDVDGKFTINSSEGSGFLVISFIGFVTQEISIEGRLSFNIRLKEDLSQLDEVLIIGYGKQSRELLTTSVSRLDNKAFENVPFTNAASALQGAVSGVRVQSISGQPGAAPRIIVRGGTSINNPNGASPLYIIDGVIRTDMNDINPDDIESLQVLKDAASTSIYGARGSNGVVIISTKSGKSGQNNVSYSYDLTTSDPGKLYEMTSARDYLTINRLGVFGDPKFGNNSGRLTLPMGYGTGNDLTNNTSYTTQYLTAANEYKLKEGWESMPDPVDPTKTLIFQNTDFQKLTYQTGISNNHNISVSGGTEKATFNAGVGYNKAQGTVITTAYDRLSFNLNGDIKIRDNLSVFSRILYSNANNNVPYGNTDVVFYRNAGLAPTAKFKFEDGTLAPGLNRNFGNPVYYMNNFIRENSNEKLSVTVGSHLDILPGLSFDPQISLYNTTGDSRSFDPGYWNGPLAYVVSRDASASNSKWRQTQADAVFSYSKSFHSDHNLEAKAGISYFGRESSSLSANGRNASTDLIPTLNASGEATSVSSSISNQVILGYFSRVNYNYQEKYLFSFNMRYDGASNLGSENKWGIFPGVSVGWNAHREKFWESLPQAFSSFKLRGSYGINGNIAGLGDFTAQGAYGVGARYGGSAAIQNTVIPNQNLQWEQSKTFDIGTDIGIFKNRINILFDYYRRVTDNLITNLSLPQSTGFGSILTNLGSLENKGIEIEIGAQIMSKPSGFQWNISFNASKTKNKILKLPYNGTENNRVGGFYIWDAAKGDYAWKGGLQEGSPIGEMYDRKQVGVYTTDAAAKAGPIATYIVGANKTQYGGDVEYLDTDKNGLIDSRDLVYMGNMFPDWTGGFTNSIRYKNFSLDVRLDYTTGHTIFNWARMGMDLNAYGDGNLTQRYVDRSWKKQGDVTDMPRSYWGGERTQRNIFAGVTTSGNSLYNESGDFLALRELTIGYNIPSRLLERFKMRNMRLNVTGNNLYYLTNYIGLNPEEGGQDNGRYAMPRNLIFGANISF
jgi:TonB-linked SusC/RagA family outer membrane protein